MRIVYIANVRFPTGKAHGIQIAKMCEAMVAKGAKITLVVPNKGVPADPASFYGLQQKFEVKRIWVINLAPGTRLGFLLAAASFSLSAFIYLLLHRDYDVTYSIDIDNVSALGTLFSGKPCFFEMHAPRGRNIVNRIWFSRVAGLMPINKLVSDTLIKNFPRLNGRTLISPNGVDLARYNTMAKSEARNKLKLDPNAVIAVYTGSFQGWKGIETIIRAAAKFPSYHFFFAGGTEDDLRRMGFSDQIPGNVKMVGKRDFKEMYLWHIAADFLLVTGTKKDEYSYQHTSPMKLFEYMASRSPIIASGTPAIRQVVTEREVFFHEPDDPEDLVRAIELVMTDANEAHARAENSRRKAQELTWDNRAERVLKFIGSKR